MNGRERKKTIARLVAASKMDGSLFSRAAMPLTLTYVDNHDDDAGEGGDSEEKDEDDSDTIERVKKRSSFLLHFDS